MYMHSLSGCICWTLYIMKPYILSLFLEPLPTTVLFMLDGPPYPPAGSIIGRTLFTEPSWVYALLTSCPLP